MANVHLQAKSTKCSHLASTGNLIGLGQWCHAIAVFELAEIELALSEGMLAKCVRVHVHLIPARSL